MLAQAVLEQPACGNGLPDFLATSFRNSKTLEHVEGAVVRLLGGILDFRLAPNHAKRCAHSASENLRRRC